MWRLARVGKCGPRKTRDTVTHRPWPDGRMRLVRTKPGRGNGCRLGPEIGLVTATFCGLCHIIQWPSKFTGKLVTISLGEDIWAFSEILDRVTTLREFFAPSADLSPGAAGLGDCEGLSTHLEAKRGATEKSSVGRFLGIRQALDSGELDKVHWVLGPGNLADEAAKERSDVAPSLRLLLSGYFCLGTLRPLGDLVSTEGRIAWLDLFSHLFLRRRKIPLP